MLLMESEGSGWAFKAGCSCRKALQATIVSVASQRKLAGLLFEHPWGSYLLIWIIHAQSLLTSPLKFVILKGPEVLTANIVI